MTGRSDSRPQHIAISDSSVDLREYRSRLAARLGDIRRQRLADEAEANQLPQLLRAIALARRDRDGGVSRRLRDHRDQLERFMTDAEDLIVSSIRANVIILARQLDEADPIVHQARRAAQRGRDAVDQINRALAEALS